MSPTMRRLYPLVRSAVAASLAVPMVLSSQATGAAPDLLLSVQWGTSADSVRARAADAGWVFLRIDTDSDYVFRTEVRGQEAVVFASFGNRGLTRLEAAFTPQRSGEFMYRDLVDTLRAHYGPAAFITDDADVRPARGIVAAAAWPGVLMGLRRDGWISLIFTCPEASPRLPLPRGRVVATKT
jgi:hypothetical protein